MPRCQSCGTELLSGVRFCPNCGQKYIPPPPGQEPAIGISDSVIQHSKIQNVGEGGIGVVKGDINITHQHTSVSKTICPFCKGLGGDPCPRCRGTGKCVRCGGNGDCNQCRHLRNSEKRKDRKAARKCALCKGTGTCPDCGGSGSCSFCEGRRITEVCDRCGGSGFV